MSPIPPPGNYKMLSGCADITPWKCTTSGTSNFYVAKINTPFNNFITSMAENYTQYLVAQNISVNTLLHLHQLIKTFLWIVAHIL
jgi:hypothetical protein